MIAVQLVYWAALACAAAACLRKNRICFRFGKKFAEIRASLPPPLRYADLYCHAPNIDITAENFDEPVRYILVRPEDGQNRRELLKLHVFVAGLKDRGEHMELVVSAEPVLWKYAVAVFCRNKYHLHRFERAPGRIRWRYPRFPALAGNPELCDGYRRVRRCILNFYHRNKYKKDRFFELLFENMTLDEGAFRRSLTGVLANAFLGLNLCCRGVLAPMSSDEAGVFFAVSLFAVSALHIDLAEMPCPCIVSVRRGKLPVVWSRKVATAEEIFFPELRRYFQTAPADDLRAFNYLCARPFLDKFGGQDFAVQPELSDPVLRFLLEYPGRPAAAALEEWCARCRMLSHNAPEPADFFAACGLYLVLLAKILKFNICAGRAYFLPPAEALPLALEWGEKRVEFAVGEGSYQNNGVSLRSEKNQFTIFVT